MNDWNSDRFNQLNSIAEEVNELSPTLEFAASNFWFDNTFNEVNTPEDVYRLADVMLAAAGETAYDAEHRCARDFLVTLIVMLFDYYDLFAYPRRKRYAYCKNDTHVSYLASIPEKLDLAAFDQMIGKNFRSGMRYDKNKKCVVRDLTRSPHPNWLCVIQWQQTVLADDKVREEAWEIVCHLLPRVLADGGNELTKQMLDLRVFNETMCE